MGQQARARRAQRRTDKLYRCICSRVAKQAGRDPTIYPIRGGKSFWTGQKWIHLEGCPASEYTGKK